MTVDWVRQAPTADQTYVAVENSVFIKETTNYGNLNDTSIPRSDIFREVPVGCSAIYPEAARTWRQPGSESLGHVTGLQVGDDRFFVKNVTFINYEPNCFENPPTDRGSPTGYCGPLAFPVKKFRGMPPHDRTLEQLYFINSTWFNSYHSNCNYYFGAPTGRTVGDFGYLTGYRDIDGSLPCSPPGSYWMFANNDTNAEECEYRPQYDMHVCPPFDGIIAKINFWGALNFNFDFGRTKEPQLQVEWECNKTFVTESRGLLSDITLRTDREYQIQFTSPEMIRYNTFGMASSDPTGFTGMWLIYKFENQVVSVENWNRGPMGLILTDKIQSECTCGTTYARFWLANEGITYIVATANSSVTCSSECGSPFALENPSSVPCGQRPVAPADQECPLNLPPGFGSSTSAPTTSPWR